jgi:hypothetical protein
MSEYDPENPSIDDDQPVERPTPIRRIGRRDRKRQLRQNNRDETTNPFETLDDSELIEPAQELPNTLGRPLPDEAGPEPHPVRSDYILDSDDRYPPVVVAKPQTRTQRRSQNQERNNRSEVDRSQPMASKRRAARQNRIALVFFLATLAAIAYFVYIWQNPYSVLNPFAPERPIIYVTATPGAGTPGTVDNANGIASFTYGVSGEIQTSAASDQCDNVILTGLIHGTTPEQGFAVRAIGGESDEGVLTSYFEDARAQVYLITLPMPQVETLYSLQLYDLAGQPLTSSVPLTVTPGCDANRVSINFTALPPQS